MQSRRSVKLTVIGCGAVGSHIAVSLAASGVGELILVDNEDLSPDNVHRHALGMNHVCTNKAESLAEYLTLRFPHLKVVGIPNPIEEVLESPEAVDGDAIVIATGDETLGRRLCEYFYSQSLTIHAWLEPLGVGGHVLVSGVQPGLGCYECVFVPDEVHGLRNATSLVSPGQDFNRSLAGCRGTFTPFGVLDAQRAAVEASRETIRCLTDNKAVPRVVTWTQSAEQLVSAGFTESVRFQMLGPDARQVNEQYHRPDCAVCGPGQQ